MRLPSLLRRLVLPAAVAGLALGGFAAPAHAETIPPLVATLAPEQVTVIEGKTKTVRTQVINAGGTTAKGVTVKFSKIDPDITLTLPAGCDATSCTIGNLAKGARHNFSFTLTAPAGTDLTAKFTITTSGAAGVLGDQSEVTVVRAKGGVDVEVEPIADLKLGRSQAGTVPVVVHNAGTDAVDAIGVILIGGEGLQAVTKYRNCETDPELGDSAVVCLFDQKFAPGETFTVPADSPLQIKVAPDAGGPYTYGAAVVAVGVNHTTADALARKKSGPLLRLEASDIDEDGDAPDDINEDDNIAEFGVQVPKSSADVAAVGDTFKGAIGDTVTAKVGVHNLGPTAVIPPGLDWILAVKVTIPAGIELTKVDEDCAPGKSLGTADFFYAGVVSGHDYICIPIDRLRKGDQALFGFTGTIADVPQPDGAVTVYGGAQDTNKINDKATIRVSLTGGGAGGGLPVTGTPIGLVALGGALLLIAGTAAFVVARRRRIITTV